MTPADGTCMNRRTKRTTPSRRFSTSTTLGAGARANKERTKVTRIALRYTFPQELAALLHYNGFTIVRQYGDWNREPLTAESTSIIMVCRKRA